MHKLAISLFLFFSFLQGNELEKYFNMSLEDLLNVEVSTSSKYSERLLDSPANIHVFTEKTIKERAYKSVDDILQSLPGTSVRNFVRTAPSNDVGIRGIVGSNKFLILLNGIRISTPAGNEINIGRNYPIYHAAKVEVLIGGASVTYGADAFMGVVNIITHKENEINELEVMAGNDDYLNAYANLSHKLENGALLQLSLSGYHSEDYDFAQRFPELYTTPAPSNVIGDYDFSPTKDLNLFATYSGKNIEIGFNHFEHASSLNFNARPTTSAFDTGSEDMDRLSTLYIKAKTDINRDFKSETSLYYSRYEKDANTYFNNSFSGFNKAYKYAKTDRYSLLQDFTYRFDDHIISSGFTFDHFNVIPIGPDLPSKYDTSKSSDDQNMYYIGTSTGNDIPIDFLEYDYQNYGIYLQDNYRFNDEWRMVLGLRYDENTLYGSSTNPRASIIYRPNQKNNFKLLYSHAFLAPSSDQLYRQFGSFAGFQVGGLEQSFFYHVSNPDLKPETIDSIELNYDHFFNEDNHLKIAPYFAHINDSIEAVFNPNVNDTTSISGANLVNTESYENLSKTDIYGVDISYENRFELDTLSFQNWLNLSYTDGKIKAHNTASQLNGLSEYQLKAGSTISYNEDFLITPKVFWVSPGTTGIFESGSSGDRIDAPSYFLMDLNLQYRLSEALLLRADIYNLFDVDYFHASRTQDSALYFQQAPQPGRLISAGLYYKF